MLLALREVVLNDVVTILASVIHTNAIVKAAMVCIESRSNNMSAEHCNRTGRFDDLHLDVNRQTAYANCLYSMSGNSNRS